MLQKYTGIVLHTVKYNDKSNIIHIYTETEGEMSFLVPLPRSRKATVKSVLFQPLSIVEFEAEIRPKTGLHPIKEARMWYLFHTLPYNPYKSAIAMFLAEFLFRALKEEAENRPLFAYLIHSRFLGLYPNTENYTDGCYFDLMNACFSPSKPLHGMFVRPEEAAQIRTLLRMNYDTMHLFSMSRRERNRCLDIMDEYYRLHLPDFPELKSLTVLQELFT